MGKWFNSCSMPFSLCCETSKIEVDYFYLSKRPPQLSESLNRLQKTLWKNCCAFNHRQLYLGQTNYVLTIPKNVVFETVKKKNPVLKNIFVWWFHGEKKRKTIKSSSLRWWVFTHFFNFYSACYDTSNVQLFKAQLRSCH